MKSDSTLAAMFNALGHPSRVAIFRCLLARGHEGQSFGALSADLSLTPSTLTHHLREMERANVVLRQAAGRSTILRLNLTDINEILQDLTTLCCSTAINFEKV